MRRLVLPGALLAAAAIGPAAAQAPRGVVERDRSLAGAATAPLEDTNLKRVRIPRVLTAAVADPYDMKGMNACSTVALELTRLDEALGPDIDQPDGPDTRTRLQKGGTAATSLIRVGAQSLVPFRGFVRELSGAAEHAREVQEAVTAGAARRGFLKGVGMKMNCAQPAAPYGFRPAPPQKPRVISTTKKTTRKVTTSRPAGRN